MVLLAKYLPSADDFIEKGEWESPCVLDFINRHFDLCAKRGSTLDGSFPFEFICESMEGFLYKSVPGGVEPTAPSSDEPTPERSA